jgi:hypothetical protein
MTGDVEHVIELLPVELVRFLPTRVSGLSQSPPLDIHEDNIIPSFGKIDRREELGWVREWVCETGRELVVEEIQVPGLGRNWVELNLELGDSGPTGIALEHEVGWI